MIYDNAITKGRDCHEMRKLTMTFLITCNSNVRDLNATPRRMDHRAGWNCARPERRGIMGRDGAALKRGEGSTERAAEPCEQRQKIWF